MMTPHATEATYLRALSPELLAELDELARLEAENPLACYWAGGMSEGQREFHGAPRKYRLLRKGNKTGGTYAISAEVWAFLLGTHDRAEEWGVPCPCTVLYVTSDLEASYADDVCKSLRELQPPGALHPDCTYDAVRGYYARGRRGILLANGSQVIFRSGKQDGMSLEGIWAHVVVVNEPPLRSRWGGIVRAAALTGAPILMVFTSVGLDLRWLRREIEAAREMWDEVVIVLTPEAVPWRSRADVEAQIRSCPSWEREQRIYAGWESLSPDRSYDGFGPQSVTTDVPDVDAQIVLGIDHGERPGHEAAVVIARWIDEDTRLPHAYVFGEYVSPGRTTPEKDARNIEAQLAPLGVTLTAVTEAFGDVNTAGKSAAGMTVNRAMEGAFADLAGRPRSRPPFPLRPARKGPGSVLSGMKVINAALIEERLKVHPRCVELIRCMTHWRGTKVGTDEEYTHLLDALRYAMASWLDTSTRSALEILVS